ncbi:MAG: GNAT family N-acetyltransferase [Candidatus Coproplasma sp.]
MIKTELLSQKNFSVNSLDSYIRRQEVKRVFRKIGDEYRLVDKTYVEDWSLEQKRQIATSISNGDHISYVALDGAKIVGFVSLKNKLYGKYIILDYLHISAEYRGQGTGRNLFNLARQEAKKAGAKSIYISACSSEETVAFYRAMGAELTDNPIKEFSENEPYDLQMICSLE